MFEKDPGIWGWFATGLTWVKSHPYLSWGSVTAFLVATWSGLTDKNGWCSSLFGGLLATIITLSILAVMKQTGLHEEWMPVVGLIVGFVGADRIRAAILGGWATWRERKVNQMKK